MGKFTAGTNGRAGWDGAEPALPTASSVEQTPFCKARTRCLGYGIVGESWTSDRGCPLLLRAGVGAAIGEGGGVSLDLFDTRLGAPHRTGTDAEVQFN